MNPNRNRVIEGEILPPARKLGNGLQRAYNTTAARNQAAQLHRNTKPAPLVVEGRFVNPPAAVKPAPSARAIRRRDERRLIMLYWGVVSVPAMIVLWAVVSVLSFAIAHAAAIAGGIAVILGLAAYATHRVRCSRCGR